MAPFDNPYSSSLVNKLSPLLEGQVPDFIQSDHPIFVQFLKSYFEYLEAGELRVSVVIDNLLLELETESFVLDSDDNKVVLEDKEFKSMLIQLKRSIMSKRNRSTENQKLFKTEFPSE